MKHDGLTHCERCGVPARGADGSPSAKMLRRAQRGFCLPCAVVMFLQQLENMYGADTWRGMPECLRLPHVQKQFASMMRAGCAEAKPEEVDWEEVIAKWSIVPHAEGVLF